MSEHPELESNEQQTAVDDVRRVRERLSGEANGDLATLARESNRAVEELSEKLGLKTVLPPAPTRQSDGTRG